MRVVLYLSLMLAFLSSYGQRVRMQLDSGFVLTNDELVYYPENIRFVTGAENVVVSKVEVTVAKGRTKLRSFILTQDSHMFIYPDTLFGHIRGARITFEALELSKLSPVGDTIGRKEISQYMLLNISENAERNPNQYAFISRYGGGIPSYRNGMSINPGDTLSMEPNPLFFDESPDLSNAEILIIRGNRVVKEFNGCVLLPDHLQVARPGDRILFIPNLPSMNYRVNIPIVESTD